MTKYQSHESKFLEYLAGKFDINQIKSPMIKTLLISLTSLFTLIDKDPRAQKAVREMLTTIKEEWYENEST